MPFGQSVTVEAGSAWVGRVTVPFPVSSPVQLKSLNPAFVPALPSLSIPPNQTEVVFSAPPTARFSAPPPNRSVPIVAMLEGVTSTAVVNVNANP